MTDGFGDMRPASLEGVRLVTLAQNVPGPTAAARLRGFGTSVVKVEPPGGDPLASSNPAWYEALASGQEVIRLDLKSDAGRARLDERLAEADVLLTSSRPGSLTRLGLGPEALRTRYPRLCCVAITGYPAPREDAPGHDLTYLAEFGLLSPPEMPRTLLADLAGAERAVSATLALLLDRERGMSAGYAEVALSEAAAFFAEPCSTVSPSRGRTWGRVPRVRAVRGKRGLGRRRRPGGALWERLLLELDLEEATREDLEGVFPRKTAEEWEVWAEERDLPLAALREAPPARSVTQTMNKEA